MANKLSNMATAVALLALCGGAMSFSFSGPRMESFARRIASSRLSTKPVSDLIPAFRRASTERLALRMADAPSTNEETDLDSQIEEEEASTVLSTDDLDARIAALGLGEGKVLEDRSTGEDPEINMNPLARAQKQSADLGKAAIDGAASGLISILNSIETPLKEEEWKNLQQQKEEEKKKANEVKEPEGESLLAGGGIVVVIPALLVGGAIAFWALASDLNMF